MSTAVETCNRCGEETTDVCDDCGQPFCGEHLDYDDGIWLCANCGLEREQEGL